MRSLAIVAILAVTLAATAGQASAVPLSEPVQCSVTNLTPTVGVGQQARYVVELWGGLGSYQISFYFGDGLSQQQSVSASSATFVHVFAAPGLYTQTAYVTGAGSQDMCRTTTSVH